MVNPFRKSPLRFHKESQTSKSTEESNGNTKTIVDSPREPALAAHAAQGDALSAIRENSVPSSHTLSLSPSLSLLPSPVEVISIVSSINMNQLLGLPSSGKAEEEESERLEVFPRMSVHSSNYDEGSGKALYGDEDVGLMSHPTSYILNTFDNDLEMDLEMEFKKMVPLAPESAGDGDEDEDEDETLGPISAHMMPPSSLFGLKVSKVSKVSTPESPRQEPTSTSLTTKLKGTHPLLATPLLSTTENLPLSMNPNIARSNDQVDRLILSTQEDEETLITDRLSRRNAIIGHRSAIQDFKDFETRIKRSKSLSKSYERRNDGSSPPLMFSQNTSLLRSKSLNSVGAKSKLSEEVTAEDISKSVRGRPPTLSVNVEAGSLDVDNAYRAGKEDSPGHLPTVGDTGESDGRGTARAHQDGPLASRLSMTTVGAIDTDSPYFILTDDTELNCTKKMVNNNKSRTHPSVSKASSLRWFNTFKGNFYKAEDSSLNPEPQDTNLFIGAVSVPSIPTTTKTDQADRQRVEEPIGRPGFEQAMARNAALNTIQLQPEKGEALRSANWGCTTSDNGDPEDSNKSTVEERRRKLDRRKTIGIWCLAVIIIALLSALIPLSILCDRGTDKSLKKYLSNITPEHRLKLLEPYHWELSRLRDENTTAPARTPEAELQNVEMKTIVSTNKEVPSGRIRGGLRNSKFKTPTIAGSSKFSEIPLKFQRSNELRSVMENSQLHNVFYGIDYAPKNVIYPECGISLPDVMLDLGLLSQVTSRIRTYGTQCNQTRYILDAIRTLNLNVSLSVGVWIGANEETNERQIRDLKAALSDYPREHFESVFVGNEVLFREDQSPERLIRYIQEVKSFVQMELNWDLPVGTSDVGHKTDPSVLNSCDFYGSNTHPFFQGDSVQGSTQWVFDYMQYQIEPFKHLAMTENKIPKVMISEVGWPSAGGSYKNSTAGEEQLQQFLDAWVCEANNQKYPWYFFEAFDEPWKMIYHREGAEWETHWGLFTADRRVKEGIRLPNCSTTSTKH